MEFRVLGPLEVTGASRRWEVGARKPRVLLATLLTRPNELVSNDYLIEAIWGDSTPANPRAALQTYVTRVRQSLRDVGSSARIEGSDSGYRMVVAEAAVDLSVFGALAERAEAAAQQGDLADEVGLLREALALWRGEPLADIDSELLLRDVVPRLVEWRLQVLQRRLDLDLQLGRHNEVVGELRALTVRHPLRERLWWQLMTALHGCGRRAEALEAYRQISRRLADELGIDPGAKLRELHRAVLNGESEPDPAAEAGAPGAGPVTGPGRTVTTAGAEPGQATWLGQCRLPPVVPDFVGRDDAVSVLLDQLRPIGGEPPARVVTVSGLPGSGKTALALYVAHALRADYPGGQWFVRLGGAGPDPRSSAHVLDELLRTAGVEGEAIPADPAEREGALRARLADHRVLLVLDDAADAAQVLPLLPGTRGCAVLVTSRAKLGGLTALAGARPYQLDALDEADARNLVARILGPDRVRSEPEAAEDLARLCGRLPLALRIAMVNLLSRPHTTIAEYVAELGGHDRLRKLAAAGEPEVAVQAAFDLSYASLSGPTRTVFRRLGLFPADFAADAAAAVVGGDPSGTAAQIATLTAASLVEHVAAERFRLHDLTRLYAVERLTADESAAARDSTRRRLFEWYLRTSLAAGDVLGYGTSGPPPPLPDVPERVRPRTFEDFADALEWLDAERDTIRALIRRAVHDGVAPYAWHLFEAIQTDLRNRNHTVTWEEAVTAALHAAIDDPGATVRLRLSRGTLYWALGRFDDALAEMSLALPDARAADHDTELRALNNLGLVHLELGQMDQASLRLGQALAVAERTGASAAHQTRILNNLGVVSLERAELGRAREQFTASLAASREAGLLYNERMCLDNLGEVHRELGDLEVAGEYFQAAVTLGRRLQARHLEAMSLVGQASVHADAGRLDEAGEAGHTALAIAQEVRNPRTEADARNVLGLIALRSGDVETAAVLYGKAHQLARLIRYRRAEVQALIGLTWAGGPVEHARRALTLAREGGLRLLEAAALSALAARDGAGADGLR